MSQAATPLETLQAINSRAAFNLWSGFEVVSAAAGEAEIVMPWRPEAGQYSGFLHAGIIGALLDTACGFAAATLVGPVLAAHYSVNFLTPAIGTVFRVRGRVVRAGKRQIFTAAELFAEADGKQRLVATGEALLMPAAG